jgi:lysophospholipase L1-like esterase
MNFILNFYNKIRGHLAGFLLVVFSIAISIAFAEFSAQYFLYERFSPSNGKRIVSIMVGDSIAPDNPIERRPYFLYVNRPGYTSKDAVQHNQFGYRGPEISQKKPKGTIRILAIGASTTYGYMLDSPAQAWPAQLEKILSKSFSDKKIEVINAGLPGGLSSESLISYLFRDRYFEPDIVVIHNGGNDAAPLFYADYQPDYSSFRKWDPIGVQVRPAEGYLLKRSFLVRWIYSVWLNDQNLASYIPQPPQWPSNSEMKINIEKNQPIGYERYLELLVQQIQRDGAQAVLFPFYLADKSVYKELPKEARYVESIHDLDEKAINKNIATMKLIGKKYEAPYIELSKGSIPNGFFFDHCHLKEDGETIKASFVAEKLTPLVTRLNARQQ